MKSMKTVLFAVALLGGLAMANLSFAADYNCVVLETLVTGDSLRIECAEPATLTRGSYPVDTGHRIRAFAVDRFDDTAWVDSVLEMTDLAIASGMPIRFSYQSGDYSGESYGCSRNNCRKPTAFNLVKTLIVTGH